MKSEYTVIMSIYIKVNPNYLKESIDSIVNQSFKPKKIILIKDGKLSDEQNFIIDNFNNNYKNLFDIYEFNDNKGAGYAYNFALDKCITKWAAIMDSDDIADLHKFEKQMNYLNQHKNIDLIASNAVEFIDRKDNIISTRIMPQNNEEIVKFAHGRCPIIQPTAIFNVKSVIDAGSYQHSPLTEDYDLYIRMIMNGCRFYTYQEILYYIRTSEDFFKRRGGMKYLKPILSFKYKYLKNGFFSTKQFLKTFLSSLVVSLMPNKMRTFIYKKFLRN